ncbi:RNA 2',3'-cyclic phosphodiesterase [Desulfosporosinus sp.]|uniref:RNA 2',3'-cyclic phosphodiesterase n=1 Tax=Desulfosporosinus sp. TaxID=157907 RepID=UPI0025BE455A|nr:RNA 2',3'-cyclic phosphodiesterase [Desulfosporosinus sp.]MBC2729009.1 RNA 2',3'-cyclic phosphodiesterase [Desulfosporosinus sp.]
MRLFIGIDLPVEIKHALVNFQSELRALGVNGSFKSQDNFHITLEFLGELGKDKIPVLNETISKVASNYKSFDLNISGVGAFPSFKRPHTLWTAVQGCLNELNSLRNELHRELQTKGFKLDERQFKPHITLASRPSLGTIDFSMVYTKKIGKFMVAEVVLFESRPVSGKRVYVSLFKAGLITAPH